MSKKINNDSIIANMILAILKLFDIDKYHSVSIRKDGVDDSLVKKLCNKFLISEIIESIINDKHVRTIPFEYKNYGGKNTTKELKIRKRDFKNVRVIIDRDKKKLDILIVNKNDKKYFGQ